MKTIPSAVSRFRSAALAACLLLPAFVSAAPPVAGPNVNMVSGTKFPEGDPFATKQNEPTIAVSSRNPRHLLAASNDYRQVAVLTAEGQKGGKAWNTLYKSVDGGTSWRSVVLAGCPLDIPQCNDPTGLTASLKALAPDFSADPTIRSGPHGTFFYTFIAGRRDGSADGVVGAQRFVDKNNNIQRDTDVRNVGGQNLIKWAEDPIIPDKFNIIDRGTSGQFIDKPWNAADVGGRPWNAGKTCELLSWTKSSALVTPSAETVPAFNVYVSYALFAGGGNNEHPTVYVAASQDCGSTFAKPVKVSNSLDANSGTSLVVDPTNGAVYVFWRRFGSLESPVKPDQIVMNKSTDGGKTWLNQPVVVTEFVPYDQGTTGGSFRTLAFPSATVSVDGNGTSRIHVAFTARSAPVAATPPYACQASDPKLCDARMRIATSTNGGLTWLPPTEVDPIPAAPANPAGRGHQFQPALTFAAGKLFITWLDQRFDQTEEVLTCPDGDVPCTGANLVRSRVPMGNLDPNCKVDVSSAPLSTLRDDLKALLGPDPGACYEYRTGRPASVWTTYLTDGSPGLVRRHTVDLFAAMADPVDSPSFAGSSGQISQYLFGSTTADSEGKYAIRQKELFAPNLPLYINGGAAFIGDYIDSGGQNIVATNEPDPALPGKYRYKFNVGSAASPFTVGGLSPVFHVAHTDNRNVIPPITGDWTAQTCMSTAFTGNPSSPTTNYANCSTPGFAGNRNQDVFSTIVTPGSVAYANANAKTLLSDKPRGFVVTVDNFDSDLLGRTYRMSIVAPTGVTASFDKDSFAATSPVALLPDVEVQVQPRSSATRSVWVKADSPNASFVVQITSPPGCSGVGCYSTQVVLNSDPGATQSLVGTGDGPAAEDVANNDLGNVVLSNAVLTNNVLSNNALSNAALSNNALTNAALSNVVLSNAVLSNLEVENAALSNNALTNAVLSNVVLSNAVLTNVVLTNAEIGNVVLSNNVLSNDALGNAVLSNNALTNVALTNIDPANVALSNAALTNNVLSNSGLSNVMLTNAALTNAALTNVALSNVALSNNALSNNALSNNALSNNALSNAPEADDLRTVEAANPDLAKNTFTSDDLQVSDFLDASFTVRNRGNTDTTLAVKLLLRDATCTGGSCSLPPGVKLQLVMRKITLTPTAIPPTGPAVSSGRAYRLGLVQTNAQVSNIGTPEIVDPAAPDLGKFLPSKADAATLPLSPGERAYVTLRAVGATAGFNLTEFLRWGVKTVLVDANNNTNTRIPLIIKTLTLPAVTAGQPASLTLTAFGGLKTGAGTTTVTFDPENPPICTDSVGTPATGGACPTSFTGGAFADDNTGTQTSTAQLGFTPPIAGTFYVLVKVKDASIPPQEDRQLLKVVVNLAEPVISGFPPTSPPLPLTLAYGETLTLPTLSPGAPGAPTPTYSTTGPCYVDANVLHTTGTGECVISAVSGETAVYQALVITADPIVINKQSVTVTANAQSKTYGDADPALTYQVTSGTLASGDSFTGSLTRAPGNGVGSYAITQGSLALNSNYVLTFVGANLTITTRAISVKADAKSKVYGTADPALTYQITSGSLVAGDSFSGSLARAPGENVGTYAIMQGTLALSGNYALSYTGADLTITQSGTSTAVTAVPNPASAGSAVAFTATVSPTTGGGTPSGNVTFKDGATPIGAPATLDGTGKASTSTSTLSVGSHTITADYAGTPGYASSSGTVALTIDPLVTTTSLTATPATAIEGTTISLSATVSPTAATGTVTFFDGATSLGTASVSSGTASFSTSGLALGAHVLKAHYNGDGTNAQSDSNTVTVTITPAFAATGLMVQPRSFHTSTLLNDGRVLVAGGFDASGAATATSEVYCAVASAVCPAASVGTFAAVGNLPSKSAAHGGTLLNDGRVLVTGGGNSSSEAFNATSNTWASSGGMSSVRSYHTATKLPDGRVLLVGGADNAGKTQQTTIIFNPTNNSFSSGPTMTTPRERHSAILLTSGPNQGKVLIVGGRQRSGNGYVVLKSAELCNATVCTGNFTTAPTVALPQMTDQRFAHAMTTLSDGKVAVAGGSSNTTSSGGTSALDRSEVYDPVANTWSAPITATARRDHTLTRLFDGDLLAAGGLNATPIGTGELFDGAAFSSAGSMVKARFGHRATRLPDGRVLITGGTGATTSGGIGTAIRDAELYNGPAYSGPGTPPLEP